MARPQLPAASRKDFVIAYRLTASRRARLAFQAAVLNYGINEYACMLAFQPMSHIDMQISAQSDPTLVKQLHYIGHNLNQLVKRTHVTGRVPPLYEVLSKRINDIIDEAIEREYL